MEPRVLILDNAVHRVLFRPHRHWAGCLCGIETDVVNVPSGRPIPSLGRYTHLLVTGSEASIVEPRPWFPREAVAIREAVKAGTSVLGSCFGHQMLVYALSGPAYLRRSPVPEIGWIALELVERDRLLTDVPNPWHTFSYHCDEVVDPPPPWRVLARSADCAAQVLRFGDRTVWGIQPHPELPLGKARTVLAFYLLVAGRRRREHVHAMRRPTREDRVAERIVARFLSAGS